MIDLDAIDAMTDTVTDEDLARADAAAVVRRNEVKARLANHVRSAGTYQAAVRQATPKMVGFVMVLLRKLADHNPDVEAIARSWWMTHASVDAGRVVGTDLPYDKVSEIITKLKGHLAAPAVQTAVQAPTPTIPDNTTPAPRSTYQADMETLPEGRYALPVLTDDGTPDGDKHRYFKVKIGKRSGRKYLVEGHGGGHDDLVWGDLVKFEHGAGTIARRLVEDPHTFIVLFGTKTSHCGDCGRSLSNEESRRVGIGPWCRGKDVWVGTPWYDGKLGTDEPVSDDVTPVVANVSKPFGRIDHSACTHPRTPAGRAACRASR